MKTRSLFFALLLMVASFSLTANTNHKYKEASMTGFYQIEAEEELVLENWMVNDCYWICKEINCMRREFDNALELESWMTDQISWDLAILAPVEKEEKLTLESWMMDSGNWKSDKTNEQLTEKASLAETD